MHYFAYFMIIRHTIKTSQTSLQIVFQDIMLSNFIIIYHDKLIQKPKAFEILIKHTHPPLTTMFK